VPESERARIFGRFYQVAGTPARHGGPSLGLAICQDLVRRHGGRIAVTGAEGGTGAVFEVVLPRHRGGVDAPPPPVSERAAAPVEVPPGSRVLVVDDDQEIVDLLLETLRLRGLEAEAAADGAQALARLEDDDGRFDAILLDVAMAGMDGFAVLARLREAPATREIPVLLITAAAGDDLEDRATAAGATGLLRKPFPINELLRRLAESCASTPAPA